MKKRFILKSGRLLWCFNTKSRAYDSEGNFKFYITSIEDISVRKNYEEALRESEERFRRAIEDSPIPIMIHAEDGEITLVNEAWTDLSGYSREDIPTIPDWTKKAYGRKNNEIQSFIKSLYNLKGKNVDLELNVRTRDGRQLIWQFYSAPLGNLPDGRRLVISMAIDITNRRIIEENLRQSEESFRLLADSLPQIIWSTDPEGWPAYYNKKWTEFTGLSLEESQGWKWLDLIHTEDQQRTKEKWIYALSSGKNYEIEHRLRRKDGTYCWFLTRSVPMKEGGGTIKWFGSSTNINEIKEIICAFIQLPLVAFLKELGVTVHHAQRFLKVVRGNVGELFEFDIRPFELFKRFFESCLSQLPVRNIYNGPIYLQQIAGAVINRLAYCCNMPYSVSGSKNPVFCGQGILFFNCIINCF